MISPRAMLALFALSVLTAPLVLSEFQVIQMNYIGVAAIIALGLVLLTGVAVPAASWWLLPRWWITAPLTAGVLLWWWLFLVVVPTAWRAEQAEARDP